MPYGAALTEWKRERVPPSPRSEARLTSIKDGPFRTATPGLPSCPS